MSCENIPSVSDLERNKEDIDDFGRLMGTGTGTSTNGNTGQVRPTYNKVIEDLGFKPGSGDFTTGFTVMPGERDVAWYNPVDKNWYSYLGVIPTNGHQVFPGTNPVGDSDWTPRTDEILRTELALTSGSEMVGDSTFPNVSEGLVEITKRAGSYSQSDSISIDKTESTVFTDHGSVAILRDTTDTPNGYSVFASSVSTKKWVTVDKGSLIDIRRFKQSGSGWTEALQKAFDNNEPVLIPVDDFVFDGTAEFTDTPIVEGVNRKLSWLTSSAGLPIMRNKNRATDTTLFGKISNVGLKTAGGFTGPVDRGLIDMKSCQFFRIEDVWFFGNGNELSIGAYVEAVLNVTEASYNLFSNIYAGNLRFGLYIGGVANSNRIEYGRFQPSADCIGVYVDPGSTYVDDLTIFASGFEFPGAVSRGVLFNGNPITKNIHTVNIIGGNRFEQLLAGVSGLGVRDLICDERENYFDSCTSNISMVSSSVKPSDFAEALVLSGSLFSSMGVISLSVPSIGVYDFALDRPHENKIAAFATSDQPETTYELLSTNIVRVKTFASGGVAAAASMLSVSIKKFY